MTSHAREKLRELIQADYHKKVSAARAAIRAAKEERTRLLAELGFVDPNPEETDTVEGVGPDLTPSAFTTVHDAVNTIVRSITGDFQARTVIDGILTRYQVDSSQVNRTTVSGTLRTMAKQGILVVVEEGTGRRPSTYRLADS